MFFEKEFENNSINTNNYCDDDLKLVEKVENAYRIYKLSELFLKDVNDDYGKLKIARLRLEFARHELLVLLQEARDRGIKISDNEMIKKFYHPESS